MFFLLRFVSVVVSPDAGGVYRAKKFREGLAYRYGLDAGLAMIIKQRAKANEVSTKSTNPAPVKRRGAVPAAVGG